MRDLANNEKDDEFEMPAPVEERALVLMPHFNPGSPVPAPTTVHQTDMFARGAYAGAQLWTAIVAMAAAQLHDQPVDRESFSQKYRSRQWKEGFINRYPEWFTPEPNKSTSISQFDLACLYHQGIMQAAANDLTGDITGPSAYALINMGRLLAGDAGPETPGYCYLKLFPELYHGTAKQSFGAWPTVDTVWATGRHMEASLSFYGTYDPIRRTAHVASAQNTSYHKWYSLGGALELGQELLPGDVRLGGEDEATVVGDSYDPKTHEVQVVWAFQTSEKAGISVANLVGKVPALAEWTSIVFTGVSATIQAADTGAYISIGLSRRQLGTAIASTTRRAITQLEVATCEQSAYAAATSAKAGGASLRLEPDTNVFDTQVSSVRAPGGGARPFICVCVACPDQEIITLTLHFNVSGGAFVRGPTGLFA